MRNLLWLIASMPMPGLACAVGDPPGFPSPLRADTSASAKARITDKAYIELSLLPSTKVRLAGPPGKSVKPNSYAGMVTLPITRPSMVRVELSDTSYIDLVRSGKSLTAIDHGHLTPTSDPCSILHKFVNFRVTKGPYIIQITSAPDKKVRISTKFIDG